MAWFAMDASGVSYHGFHLHPFSISLSLSLRWPASHYACISMWHNWGHYSEPAVFAARSAERARLALWSVATAARTAAQLHTATLNSHLHLQLS